jgi:hypothetical protein
LESEASKPNEMQSFPQSVTVLWLLYFRIGNAIISKIQLDVGQIYLIG